VLAIAAVLLGTSCDGAPAADDAGTDAPAPLVCTASATPSQLVVTADWMARSLTLLGLERTLDPGCSADEARVGTIDLGAHAPGPIELEIAPDGRTALVAIGPGFFAGAGGALVGNPDPELDGTLLVVDLIDRAVLAEIATTHVPMGLAISPDGTRAYAAGFGHGDAPGSTLAIVDLVARALIEEIEVGPLPEQVALDATGAVGAVSLAGSSGVRVFRTDDVAGSLTPEITTGRDPSDIAFVAGTTLLVVTNSMAASFSVIDVADPATPIVIESPRVTGGVPYAATAIPGTTEVLLTTSIREQLLRVDALAPAAAPRRYPLEGGAFLLGVAVTDDGRAAIVPHPRSHTLSVVDLESGATHALTLGDAPGPTYVAIQPSL
jgi:DNA-binding beta-propeller fold protein YncE